MTRRNKSKKQKDFHAKVTEASVKITGVPLEKRIRDIKSRFDFRKHLLYSPNLG